MADKKRKGDEPIDRDTEVIGAKKKPTGAGAKGGNAAAGGRGGPARQAPLGKLSLPVEDTDESDLNHEWSRKNRGPPANQNIPKLGTATIYKDQGQINSNQVIGIAEESKEEEKVPDKGQMKKGTMSLSQENKSKETLSVRELDMN